MRSKATDWLLRLAMTALPPLVLLAVTAAGLRLLNTVPTRIQGPTVEHFNSIEEAERKLGVDIIVPAYFPDYFSWPPKAIMAERQPYFTIHLSFAQRATGSEALWVHQILSNDSRAAESIPSPLDVLQDKSFLVKGHQGRLIVGADVNGEPLYQLRWWSDRRYFVVTTTHSLEELIRIAESMAP
ncbi:MAG: hypothetical protein AB1603_00705 [Chloroflexota bacterium]